MHFLLPIGLAVIIGLVSYLFSVNKTKQALALKSKPLQSPELENKICALAMALDLTHLNVNVYNIETS